MWSYSCARANCLIYSGHWNMFKSVTSILSTNVLSMFYTSCAILSPSFSLAVTTTARILRVFPHLSVPRWRRKSDLDGYSDDHGLFRNGASAYGRFRGGQTYQSFHSPCRIFHMGIARSFSLGTLRIFQPCTTAASTPHPSHRQASFSPQNSECHSDPGHHRRRPELHMQENLVHIVRQHHLPFRRL